MSKGLLSEMMLPASFLLSGFYWWSGDESAVATVAKVSSTVLLACHAKNTFQTPDAHWKVRSLLFHSLGDLLIELPGQFLPAISIFLTGHALYLRTLLTERLPLSEMGWQRGALIAGFSLFGAAFTQLIMQNTTGVIQAAIPFYSMALTSMFVLSCMQKQHSVARGLTGLGYVASDMLIAYHMFVRTIPGLTTVSWPLYFAAQSLVATEESRSRIVGLFSHIKVPYFESRADQHAATAGLN